MKNISLISDADTLCWELPAFENSPLGGRHLLLVILHTRNSTIADKPRDAFRGQSRLPNMVPFHMLGMVSN